MTIGRQIHFGWSMIDAPLQTPALPLSLVKRHLRLPLDPGYTDDDVLLTKYVNSAERLIEDQAEITLRQKTWQLWLSEMPTAELYPDYYRGLRSVRDISRDNLILVRLERPPVYEITSVTYWDAGGVNRILPSTCYYLLKDASPPLMVIDSFHAAYPEFSELSDIRLDRWRIEMQCGAATLPSTAETAILLLAAYFYRHPEDDGKAPPTGTSTDRAFRDCVENLRWRCYP